MIILKEREVHPLLSNISVSECHHLLTTLHDVLRAFSAGKNVPPSDQSLHQPERESIVTKLGNTSLFMPSSVTTSTGIKIVTVSSTGLKGCINVFAPEGELVGLLNAAEVTAFRTSLAVMIPYVRWHRSKANVIVFGAGRQAEWHIKLALLLSEVKRITVVNRSGGRRMELLFAESTAKHPGIVFELLLKPSDDFDSKLRQTLTASDVIFCCTPATTPHFPSSYLDEKARFISLIGSYKPSMEEIDSDTLLSGERIYVDTKEGCLVEAGELINAKVEADQLTEIGELQGSGQFTTEKNLVFKCVGLGIMDLVIAGELLEMAKEKGIGLVMDDF